MRRASAQRKRRGQTQAGAYAVPRSAVRYWGPMPIALLLLSLANTGTPLSPALYETHLSAPAGVLLPEVAGQRGRQIHSGVSQVVSGSILLVLGGAIGAGGLYSLISAGNEADPKAKTVFTVLGWTFFGFGAI